MSWQTATRPLVVASPLQRYRDKQPSVLVAGGAHDRCIAEYEYFGLALGAPLAEVKIAYRAKALIDHPDRCGPHQAFLKTHAPHQTLVQYIVGRGVTKAGTEENNSEIPLCISDGVCFDILDLSTHR